MKSGRILAAVIGIILSFVQGAEAQIKVFKGEYIIAKPQAEAGVLARSPYQLLKQANPEVNIEGTSPEIVDLDPNDSTCQQLVASGQASFCEPNYYVKASLIPDDANYSSLYGMSLINAPTAWNASTGSTSVVVAIIDTGIDYTHPDLSENIWVNPGEIPANGIDDDANGWIDDIHGINSISATGDPMDDNGHGTHCAGTIGGKGNNSFGVAGVNWNISLMGLKFLNASGGGSIFSAIQAIDYMIDMKSRYGINLKVSNNSWGGPGYSKSLEDAISRANNAGIIFAAAAGNEANNNDYVAAYPANYNLPNVVSVAAIDSKSELAYFSNYGQSVDIAAPGVSILSTLPGARYGSLSGTSMATPHVSGALALLNSFNPNLSHTDLISMMYRSASLREGLSGKVSTSGILNVAGMLGLNPPLEIVAKVERISLRNTSGSTDLRSGDNLRLSITASNLISDVPLILSINNKECQQTKELSLKAGVNKFRAKLSALNSSIRKLSMKVSDKKVVRSIGSNVSARNTSNRLSARTLNNNCSKILRTIRS